LTLACCHSVRVLQRGGVTRRIIVAGVQNVCSRTMTMMSPRKHARANPSCIAQFI